MYKSRRNFKNNKFHRFNDRSKLTANKSTDIIEAAYNDGVRPGLPEKEKTASTGSYYVEKRFSTLNKLRPIDTVADPNTNLSYGSYPYRIIDKNNRIIDARYGGEPNIGGNTIVQLQNDTTFSQFMDVYDVGINIKSLNYLYLPIKPGSQNLAYMTEMVKSVEQAVSFGFATMTTQLPFYSEMVWTNMPVPTSCRLKAETTTNPGTVAGYQYTARLIHYQCVLQNLVAPVSKYIEALSLEKELMRMSFRTESSHVTEIYGLLKKSSFVSAINKIGTTVITEFFDENWFKQTNLINCLPSRKTKGMIDPLLNIISKTTIPSCKIKDSNGLTLYDSDLVLTSAKEAKLIDPFNNFTLKSIKGCTLEQIVLWMCALLSPYYILKMVRMKNNGKLNDVSQSQYAQAIVTLTEEISSIASRFSSLMGHTRTFIDKMDTQNMVYWTKGFSRFVNLTNIVQYEPAYNILTHNLFIASCSDGSKLKFDDKTKRWGSWTLWDKYTGIPEYNNKSHGAFLTAGLHPIEIPDGYTNESTIMLLPVLFNDNLEDVDRVVGKTHFLTRRGKEINIVANDLEQSDINNNFVFKRLSPLGNVDSIRVPKTEIDDQIAYTRDEMNTAISSCVQLISNVYGIGQITNYNYREGEEFVIDNYTSPDALCFIDFELEDVTNEMIVFARNYSPFRVSTPSGERTMGFSSGK